MPHNYHKNNFHIVCSFLKYTTNAFQQIKLIQWLGQYHWMMIYCTCTGHSDNSNYANKQCSAFRDGHDRVRAVQPSAGSRRGSTVYWSCWCCSGLGPEEHTTESVCESGCRHQSCSRNPAQEPNVWGSWVRVPASSVVSDPHHVEKCTAGIFWLLLSTVCQWSWVNVRITVVNLSKSLSHCLIVYL